MKKNIVTTGTILRAFVVCSLCVVCFTVLLSARALAQGSDAEEEPNIPEPKTISLTTKDQVLLKCTYYAKPKDVEGKKTTPVILVHAWGGKRSDFGVLATALQASGRAVICPDLRGHGESTKYKQADGTLGDVKTPDKMRTDDIKQVVFQDMETVKKFLLDENNAGSLNIDQLCVVGSETSAPLVMGWTAYDWSAPPLTTGKQGQYVKAYILLSPDKACEGVTVTDTMNSESVAKVVAAQILVGAGDRRVYTNAQRIFNSLEGKRSRESTKTIYFEKLDTKLQGTRMLQVPSLKVPLYVDAFIKKLVDEKAGDYPWEDRKSIFGG